MGSKFREHGVMIFLSRDLYVAFIKLQAEKELGRSFAALLPFTEGLYKMGYISKEVYEAHKKRYSEPLTKETDAEKLQKLAVTEKERDRLNKLFANVAKQWSEHPSSEWRRTWVKKAKLHLDVPNSQLILNLARSKETTLDESIILTRIAKEGEVHG